MTTTVGPRGKVVTPDQTRVLGEVWPEHVNGHTHWKSEDATTGYKTPLCYGSRDDAVIAMFERLGVPLPAPSEG